METFTKSGVSPGRDGSGVRNNGPNATAEPSDEEVHAAYKKFCDDEGPVCYSVIRGSRYAFGDWKEDFIVGECPVVPKEHPALAKAPIGYPMGKSGRWGQKIFSSEEDVEKLGPCVCDVDFAEDLHVVDGVFTAW